jgi:pyruvate,water dikinase
VSVDSDGRRRRGHRGSHEPGVPVRTSRVDPDGALVASATRMRWAAQGGSSRRGARIENQAPPAPGGPVREGASPVNLVLPLDDPAADPAAVGGKGASLARLARAGLPVPAGFHVTTEAYRWFVSSVRDEIHPVDPERTKGSCSPAGRCRRRWPRRSAAPTGLSATTCRWPSARPPPPRTSRACRSRASRTPTSTSAAARPFSTRSRAAGRRCGTPRAVAYRDQHGISYDNVALAVVVQVLVPAGASGVLGTGLA